MMICHRNCCSEHFDCCDEDLFCLVVILYEQCAQTPAPQQIDVGIGPPKQLWFKALVLRLGQ